MVSTRTALLALPGALALIAGCGGQDAEPPRGTAAESPPAASAPASPDPHASASASTGRFVYNTYADENGDAEQEPEGLVASEFTTFTGMEWSVWDSDTAEGRGRVSGTWCLPECQDQPYAVTVELGDPETVDGVTYYSTYEITDTGDLPEDLRERMVEADDGRLTLPGEG
jgi:hypothetical protein